MSALTNGSSARSLPLRSPLPQSTPKRTTPLRLVPQRKSSAARAPFVVTVVAILVGGLLGLLLLNTLVAQGSFALHDLSKTGRALDQREQDLSREVQSLQAPAALAARASAFGMVAGGPPAFLELPSGKILGKPTAGVAPVVVAPRSSTTWTSPKPPLPAKTQAAKAQPLKPGTAKPPAKAVRKPAGPHR